MQVNIEREKRTNLLSIMKFHMHIFSGKYVKLSKQAIAGPQVHP